MAKAKADSTKVYIEFNKLGLSAAAKKIDAELTKVNKAASELRDLMEKQVLKDHKASFEAAAPDGYECVGVSTKWGKLSAVYDLPGKAGKASSKALSL